MSDVRIEIASSPIRAKLRSQVGQMITKNEHMFYSLALQTALGYNTARTRMDLWEIGQKTDGFIASVELLRQVPSS